MKYIKTYENIEYNNNLKILSDYLINFLIEMTDLKFQYTTNEINYTFWYNQDRHLRKAIFKFDKIDYYYGDEDMFFEFKLDYSISINSKIDYIPEDLFNIVNFISNEMEKNKSQGMIKFSKINDIINNINANNYDVFINQNKYNL